MGSGFFRKVKVGMEIPPLSREITRGQLLLYATATLDLHPGHYDPAFARAQGFRDVYLDGPMNAAFLAQMVMDWAGPAGKLEKLSVNYKNMVFPGDRLTGKGRVTGKNTVNERGVIECELVLENQEGKTVAAGTAQVTFSL